MRKKNKIKIQSKRTGEDGREEKTKERITAKEREGGRG